MDMRGWDQWYSNLARAVIVASLLAGGAIGYAIARWLHKARR